jgi:hypothetical protein
LPVSFPLTRTGNRIAIRDGPSRVFLLSFCIISACAAGLGRGVGAAPGKAMGRAKSANGDARNGRAVMKPRGTCRSSGTRLPRILCLLIQTQWHCFQLPNPHSSTGRSACAFCSSHPAKGPILLLCVQDFAIATRASRRSVLPTPTPTPPSHSHFPVSVSVLAWPRDLYVACRATRPFTNSGISRSRQIWKCRRVWQSYAVVFLREFRPPLRGFREYCLPGSITVPGVQSMSDGAGLPEPKKQERQFPGIAYALTSGSVSRSAARRGDSSPALLRSTGRVGSDQQEDLDGGRAMGLINASAAAGITLADLEPIPGCPNRTPGVQVPVPYIVFRCAISTGAQ